MIERSYRRVVRVVGPTALALPAGAITGLGPAAVASFKGVVEAGRREQRPADSTEQPGLDQHYAQMCVCAGIASNVVECRIPGKEPMSLMHSCIWCAHATCVGLYCIVNATLFQCDTIATHFKCITSNDLYKRRNTLAARHGNCTLNVRGPGGYPAPQVRSRTRAFGSDLP